MRKSEREHLDAVARLGCLLCGGPACIHHLRFGMGIGQRNSHFNVLPLCEPHHTGKFGIHGMGRRAFERKYGSEVELLEQVKLKLKQQKELSCLF